MRKEKRRYGCEQPGETRERRENADGQRAAERRGQNEEMRGGAGHGIEATWRICFWICPREASASEHAKLILVVAVHFVVVVVVRNAPSSSRSLSFPPSTALASFDFIADALTAGDTP